MGEGMDEGMCSQLVGGVVGGSNQRMVGRLDGEVGRGMD